MKFKAIIISLLTISLMLFGCVGTSQQDSIKFYYFAEEIGYTPTDQVINYEQYKYNAQSLDYKGILSRYLEGPKSTDLRTPFPTGTSLVSISVEQQIANVVVSDSLSKLSGVELTLACSCLSLTVESITGCAQVQISAQNSLLENNHVITVNTNDLMFSDRIK